jgi:hypothetical protein
MKIIELWYDGHLVCKVSHVEVAENVIAILSKDLYDYNTFETREVVAK